MKYFFYVSLLISIIQAAWCLSDGQTTWPLPRGDYVPFSLKQSKGHSFAHNQHGASTRLSPRDTSNDVVAIFPRGGKPPTQKQDSGNEGSRAAQPPNQAARPFTFKAPTSPSSGMETNRGRSGRRVADLVSKYEAKTEAQSSREAGRKRPNPRNELSQLADAARPGRSSSPEGPGTPRSGTPDIQEQLNQPNPSPLRRTSRFGSPERKLLKKTKSFTKDLDKADKLPQGNRDLTSKLDPLFESPIRKVRPGGGMSPESDLSEKLKQTHLFSTQDMSSFHTPNRRTLSGTESAESDHSTRLKTIEETPPKDYTPWQSPDGPKVSEVPGAPRKLSRRAFGKTPSI